MKKKLNRAERGEAAKLTKAARTRQFIIEKSAPILNEKGIAGTSISDIMAATRLAKGGIYGNFSNKEEITVEAFDYMMTRITTRLQEVIAAVPGAKGKLLALLEFYREYPGKPPIQGGCPILNFGVETDDTDPVMRKRVNDSILYFQEATEKLIRSGIRHGEFRDGWDVHGFSVRMFAMIEGGILIGRVQQNNTQMSILIDALREELLGYCVADDRMDL